MKYTSSMTPGAKLDLAGGHSWYLERGAEIAKRFKSQVFAAVDNLRDSPLRWPIWRQPAFRRILLPDFPYMLVYSVGKTDIIIVSVMHQSRDSSARVPEDP